MADIVRMQADGRMSLAKYGVKPGQTYMVYIEKNGRIHLTPMPAEEATDG